MKRALKHPFAQNVVCWLVAGYIRLVLFTGRVRYDCHAEAQPYLDGTHQAIFAFWHSRLLLMPPFHPPGRPMHVLVSAHSDGALIAKTSAHFGVGAVTGSSSRGGAMALRHLFRLLRAGENIGITPDGPRGPAQKAAMGIVQVAKKAQLPMIPVTVAASRCRRLGSWDRFMIPLPFSRVVYVVGAPIRVEPGADMESSRRAIEEALDRITEGADRLFG